MFQAKRACLYYVHYVQNLQLYNRNVRYTVSELYKQTETRETDLWRTETEFGNRVQHGDGLRRRAWDQNSRSRELGVPIPRILNALGFSNLLSAEAGQTEKTNT